jgi:16S rRNA (uracil1498-N3)-methyltransferase
MMRRLWLPAPAFEGVRATLLAAAAHRVRDVWRLRPGAALCVFDGAGQERAATVEAASPRAVALTLGEAVVPLSEPPRPLVLGCAFPRGSRGDWLVEKATELGAARLVALDAGRAVLRPGAGRLERWRRVAVEAAEQCGRAVVPAIAAVPPGAGAEVLGASTLLLADPAAASTIAEVVAPAPKHEASPAALLVGPEGGWAPEERARWLAAGAQPVSLGPRVLRVETAAVVGLAQLAAATGALGAGAPRSMS